MSIRQELSFLTSLRFFAALSVFIFHIDQRWHLPLPALLSNIVGQGAVGMSLFFILSGFVLTYNYFDAKPLQDYKGFMVKRMARIYPVYVFAAILALFVAPIKGSSFAKLLTVGLDATLIQAWFPDTFTVWNHCASWSLSNEFFFYLSFPFLLYGLQKLSRTQQLIVLGISYLACVLPALVGQVIEPNASFVTVYSWPLYRLPEFIIGMLAGFLYKAKPEGLGRWNLPVVLSALSLVSIELGMMGFKLHNYVGHNFLVVPAFAALIYLTANWQAKGFKHLGESSYCFYLLQLMPTLFVFQNHEAVVQAMPMLANPWVLLGVMYIIIQAFASVVHLWVEKPCRNLIINAYKHWEKRKDHLILEVRNSPFAKNSNLRSFPPFPNAFFPRDFTSLEIIARQNYRLTQPNRLPLARR